LTESEFTKILDWPGYRVYRHEIDERTRRLRLWVRRKRGNRVLICSGCGGRASKIEEVREREVRDLPWRKYQTTVIVEYYRIHCPFGQKTRRTSSIVFEVEIIGPPLSNSTIAGVRNGRPEYKLAHDA
jgi:transposase